MEVLHCRNSIGADEFLKNIQENTKVYEAVSAMIKQASLKS